MYSERPVTTYGKILLFALVCMVVVFTVLYPVTISRKGFLYQDRILVPTTENGTTIYSAKVKGEQWRITVTTDKTVTFRIGDKQYGPYTAKKDPTAIPKGDDMAHLMTGIEVREGDEICFRGGIYDVGSRWMLVNEDGTPANFGSIAYLSDGTMVDGEGNIVDPMEPSVTTVLKLMQGPKLTHKGQGAIWILGVFVAIVAGVNILYADELFRLKFIFRVENPEDIEPSAYELAMRPIAWTILVLITVWTFMKGLQ